MEKTEALGPKPYIQSIQRRILNYKGAPARVFWVHLRRFFCKCFYNMSCYTGFLKMVCDLLKHYNI